MDDKKLHRCFTFSEDQLKHLRSKKYKIDRMECFMSLVDLAEPVPKLVQISKTKQVEILAGQVMVDNTQLAKLWVKDRKTVPKLLDAMESVGIFSSQEVEDNRIYTLHCLSGWYVDAKKLIQVLLPRATGKFTRKGLVVNGLRYRHDDYTEAFLRGGEAVVAYNSRERNLQG